MSKNVLISIRPQWVEKIASGEKTIEVRKTQPKLKTPFKCYIYMTQGKVKDLGTYSEWIYENRMKVIGEFICDRIICSQGYFDSHGKNHLTNVFEEDIKGTCLTEYELWNYIAGKAVKANEMYDGYLWHISDLKIYDKPKELSEFEKVCPYAYFQHNEYEGDWFCNAVEFGNCEYKDCPKCSGENNEYEDFAYCMCNGKKPLTRPPQSLCYVEVEE